MDSHKGTYDSPCKESIAEEILQGLIDDITTSHTLNDDEETATEQHNPGNHPVGATATTVTHTHTEHQTALSREVEDILRDLIDKAIASAYGDEQKEPIPDGGGGQRSVLAALLARMTSEKRSGDPPAVIVISSDEGSDDDEPFPRSLMRRGRSASKRGPEAAAPLAGTPNTAATDTTGRSGDLPSPSSARSCGASTSGSGSSGNADAGCRETIVAKIQRRPPVEFPRHAYGKRQKRRYETSSEDDEGADRGRGRGRRRRSGLAGEHAPTVIDLTLDSESEGHGRADASASSAAAPDQPPKKKNRQERKQTHEGNNRQKRRPEPAGNRNSIGQMAAAAAAARSGKRWRY
ncbi:hypothetical protein DL765_003731 [Monosporascus sp. GIB2]|nr:hypothetical protein DL765_003731 [Monosporascus sp. GIB2]